MLVNKIVHLAIVVLTIVWDLRCDAATAAVKLCGRELSDFMSRVCHAYNSPSWDVPTVIEQPAAVVRRKRRTGIADECCVFGCTWEQLSSYCAISAKSESPVDSMEAHLIADRSAEAAAAAGAAVVSPAVLGKAEASTRREVGRSGSGYGRARGRRCWCRRKRRSGRRRTSLMGNMGLIKNAARAAPVLGTVSPLLTWGRTLNTDLPSIERDRYAYIAVYT
ncbi:uncharacterized protein LOC123866169 isoform X1 [Maniola jurtina]|uniref:uncharacterized protein LOC123866169 isoform X1 n=1 Tax=Maniola jurtina TaxID=191418 RepID=UPI001E6875CB|nr:uncharacterized protein LOC123866169 isoform X1 [Maniola jurtina]XP_045763518.1 uncharacterized protein LOC123866169 isoform X1 [Maniola jurtina]